MLGNWDKKLLQKSKCSWQQKRQDTVKHRNTENVFSPAYVQAELIDSLKLFTS